MRLSEKPERRSRSMCGIAHEFLRLCSTVSLFLDWRATVAQYTGVVEWFSNVDHHGSITCTGGPDIFCQHLDTSDPVISDGSEAAKDRKPTGASESRNEGENLVSAKEPTVEP